MQLNSLF